MLQLSFLLLLALSPVGFESAKFTGPWQKRLWESIPAAISNGVVSAKLPMGKPIVYYISVIDEQGFEVSSNHQMMPSTPAK